MANKDLINLGISPDSGTGDSARRGGEKVNNLFADIYTQLGDNPVGQDPHGPFYAYRRPFYEYEYKVGELHPAGRFIPIQFATTNSIGRLYDRQWGWGYDQNGNLIDSDGDGIPDIYRDSEWYFLSRGERIDADLTNCSADSQVHFVLPIGVPGDSIIIRDGFGTWNNRNTSDSEQDSDNHVRTGGGNKNIHVSFWTTPWEFQTVNQVTEWETATGLGGTTLDSDGLSIRDPISGNFFRSNFHKVKNNTAIELAYPKLDQPFAVSRSTDPYDGLSPTYSLNTRRYQFEFLFTSYQEGWVVRQVALDAADVQAAILAISERVDKIDSDLERGLYVSADSDIRHTVPIFRRTTDGREIHGNLSLRGDPEAIMTTIDSEDTPLTNDPRSGLGGDTVQPLTTTVRFKLTNNVKIKDDLNVGKDLTVGKSFTLRGDLQRDSDLVLVHFDSESSLFTNKVNINETLTVDSDVYILGQLDVRESSTFRSDVRFLQNIWIGGDSTAIQTETLRVRDSIITLNNNANNAPLMDTGFIFQRYDQTDGANTPLIASDTLYNPFMVWNEDTQSFMYGETVTSDSEITLTMDRTFAKLGRGEFVLYDSENQPRVVFEKAYGWPDAVRGAGVNQFNPNERPTVEPDFEFHVKANTVLGRDSDDVVVFNSRIMSNLVPFGHEVYNLGDSDNAWKDLYLSGNTIHLGSVKIQNEGGTIVFRDSDEKVVTLFTKEVNSTNVIIDSELSVGGNSLLLGRLHVQDHARFDSDVYIAGSLRVDGTTTYVNTQNLEISDNTIVLNKNQPTPSEDTGLIFTRYDSDNVSVANWNGLLVWEESTRSFVLGETSSSGITRTPVVTEKYFSIGDGAAAVAPIVFDISGASDPDGLGRPTITGDGTAVLDGGVF